jgi:hypothetical protein
MFTDQINILPEMSAFCPQNYQAFYQSSDIFPRWVASKCFEKSMQVITDGFSLVALL